MNTLKQLLVVITIISSISISAQKKNIFLDAKFWKTNPSIETIDQKINEGNDIAALSSNAFDAVVYAILNKTANKTIKYLISKEGNGVNKKTHDGRTYIFWAAYKDNIEIMKHVFSKGAKTTIIDTHGNTFMNFAASAGQLNLELYKYSFEIGADITQEKNHDGANALLLVASHLTDFKLVDYFTTKGASLNDKDTNGNGLFEYAAKGGNTKFLKILLEKGIDKGNHAMIFASQGSRNKKNTLETYQFLEKSGVNPNGIDHKNRNSLHFIAKNSSKLSEFKYFIEKGVAVNLQDEDGNSPFMNAANNNSLEVVQFLSKDVKNINLKNNDGRSALAMAVNRNSIDVVQFLLEKDAAIHTVDKDDNTLSYYLINSFRASKPAIFESKLKVLEKNGLVINQLQNSENTLLHIATERNNLPLLKRLAVFKINVNALNKENLSALQIAVMKAKDDKIIKYLLSINADKNVKTAFDESIFDLASENELLKKHNINFLK
ncbi:ankyrin repeat domain-containing protein [Polaribacter sp. IC073]|uniref:ankyrin repeat domain-containing protein n=1 Tax=Polaribacter sp. IC073 TaxID=2508540 RepID=UPI0011BF13A6|nr:ankyrin repeat domain-containing protein [Polaribacter sp. IC073]TXD49080.1 ankyrin repeat domain-containing protein [Polaribacter sp. IC073]